METIDSGERPLEPTGETPGAAEIPETVDTAATHATVDLENPWPGLASFGELDAEFFHGREAAVDAILRLVDRERVTLLYGVSGLGKTSLLRAGVFPKLPAHVLPVYVRLHFRAGANLRQQVLDAVQLAVAAAGWRGRRDLSPPPAASGTLWEFFRRKDQPFWGEGDQIILPLLVFDQFEQLVARDSRHRVSQAHLDEFLQDLGDLVHGRIPSWLAQVDRTDSGTERFILESPGCKLLFSFREDFLADVTRLRTIIPALDRNVFALGPMTWEEAVRSVQLAGGHLLAPDRNEAGHEVASAIATMVSEPSAEKARATVEPAILSVFCRELNEERKHKLARTGAPYIDMALVQQQNTNEIIGQFYRRAVSNTPAALQALIEERLVIEPSTFLPTGARNSMALDELSEAERAAVEPLISEWRILRIEQVGRQKQSRLELTHDVLVRPVLEAKRRHREEARARIERETREREAAELIEAERARRDDLSQRLEMETLRRQRRELEFRRAKIYLAAFSALAVMAIAAALWAFRLRKDANEQRDLAESLSIGPDLAQVADLARAGRLGEAVTRASFLAHEHPKFPSGRNLTSALIAHNEWWLPEARINGPNGKDAEFSTLSPDGTTVASIWSDGTASLWNAGSGRVVAVLPHQDRMLTAAFSRDSRFLVTAAAEDKVASVWNAQTGARVATLAHQNRVLVADFSPDGQWLITASADGTAALWSATAWDRRFVMRHPQGPVELAGFSPDSSRIVTVSSTRSSSDLRVWAASSGRAVGPPLQLPGVVNAVAFSPDGALVTARADGLHVEHLTDAPRASRAGSPPVHETTGEVLSLQFNAAGDLLTLQRNEASIWKFDRARPDPFVSSVVLAHPREINGASFSADGRLVMTASGDGLARIWNAATGRLVYAIPTDSEGFARPTASGVSWAQFDATGTRVVTAEQGHSTAWRLQSPPPPIALGGSLVAVSAIGFSSDGSQVLAATLDGAHAWDSRMPGDGQVFARNSSFRNSIIGPSNRVVTFDGAVASLWALGTSGWSQVAQQTVPCRPTEGTTELIEAAGIDAPGSMVAMACGDHAIHVWNTGKPGGPLVRLGNHDDVVRSIEFSPNGRYVLSASSDKSARIWNASSGGAVGGPLAHGWPVSSAHFSTTGDMLVTAAFDGSRTRVIVWNTSSGTPQTEMSHSGSPVLTKFIPNQAEVITAADNGTLLVWDAVSGRAVARPLVSNAVASITSAEISRDGTRLVTGFSDGTVRVWSARTLQPESGQIELGRPIVSVGFNPDASRLVVWAPNTLELLEVPRPEPADLPWLSTLAARLSGLANERVDPLTPLPQWVETVAGAGDAVRKAPPQGTGQLQRQFERWFLARPQDRISTQPGDK